MRAVTLIKLQMVERLKETEAKNRFCPVGVNDYLIELTNNLGLVEFSECFKFKINKHSKKREKKLALSCLTVFWTMCSCSFLKALLRRLHAGASFVPGAPCSCGSSAFNMKSHRMSKNSFLSRVSVPIRVCVHYIILTTAAV